CSEKPLWLTDNFGPSGSRLSQVMLNFLTSAIGAASWKFRRFRPFDLCTERFHCCVDIAAVECRICAAESGNRAIEIDCSFHILIPSSLGTSTQTQNSKNNDGLERVHPTVRLRPIHGKNHLPALSHWGEPTG